MKNTIRDPNVYQVKSVLSVYQIFHILFVIWVLQASKISPEFRYIIWSNPNLASRSDVGSITRFSTFS